MTKDKLYKVLMFGDNDVYGLNIFFDLDSYSDPRYFIWRLGGKPSSESAVLDAITHKERVHKLRRILDE